MAVMTAVCSSSFSDSNSTLSPTASGLVEVMPSNLKMPLRRAFQVTPPVVLTTYHEPVDLYTFPCMIKNSDKRTCQAGVCPAQAKLRELSQDGPAEEELEQQENGRGQCKGEELFGITPDVGDLDPRLFEAVYFGVDVFQALVVFGAIVMAAGLVGDLGEQLFVDVYLFALHDDAAGSLDGHGGKSFGAHPNGIDAHPDGFCDLLRGIGIDEAAVVLPIGEQDDDLTLGGRVAEAVDTRG